MAAGFGGGTALFIPVIASTIRRSGYQTAFLWTGIFQGVVILVVAQFLRHPPREHDAGGEARGVEGGAARHAPVHDAARCCARRSSTCST